MQHVTIFRDAARYAGWPANYGIWNWGYEIVLGFTVGYPDPDTAFHPRDKSRPFMNVQARSRDGGRSWQIEEFPGKTPGGRGLSADEHMNDDISLAAILDADPPDSSPGNIKFTHPDFALMCARTGLKPDARGLFYVSYNRCNSWDGPYALPDFGGAGIHARTDYVVQSERDCLLLLTATKANGAEGRVICVQTVDAGRTFTYLSDIGDVPDGEGGYSIMPSSLKLEDKRILTAVRCRGDDHSQRQSKTWIDLYASNDDGKSWDFVTRPQVFQAMGHNGNPPILNALPDGRLVMTYGNRDKPYTIRARISEDDGRSWSDEITLRDGGGNHDIGYPRTVVLPDGQLVTAYYFNDQPGGKGERFIEATIWKP